MALTLLHSQRFSNISEAARKFLNNMTIVRKIFIQQRNQHNHIDISQTLMELSKDTASIKISKQRRWVFIVLFVSIYSLFTISLEKHQFSIRLAIFSFPEFLRVINQAVEVERRSTVCARECVSFATEIPERALF